MLKADHFAFRVSDMDESIGFYTDVLGLRLMSKQVDHEHQEIFAFLELSGGNLELLQLLGDNTGDKTPPPVRQPYAPHIAIQTDDVDAMLAKLKHKRVPIVKGPMEIAGEVRWLYASDPDNNVIEFVQWL